MLEAVEVGDDDLRPAEVTHPFRGHDVEQAVVVVRVGRQQHPQPIPDGDARSDDEEGVAEPAVLRVGHLVERVPGDQHRHHHGLAGPGRHLVRYPEQARIGVLGEGPQLVLDPRPALPPPSIALARTCRAFPSELSLTARTGRRRQGTPRWLSISGANFGAELVGAVLVVAPCAETGCQDGTDDDPDEAH
jgi:hypothetical protein